MDIVRFTTGAASRARAGISDGESVIDLGVASIAELLGESAAELRRRRASVSETNIGETGGARYPLTEVTLLAPIDGRTEVWAAGVTYQVGDAGQSRHPRTPG